MSEFKYLLENVLMDIPKILSALVILVVGIFLAKLIAKKIGNLFAKNQKLNNVLKSTFNGNNNKSDFKNIVVKIIYAILLIFVFVATFETLGFSIITNPLNQFLESIFRFLPNIMGGLGLFLIAWIIASVLRTIVVKFLVMIDIDKKIKNENNTITKPIGDILFGFIIIMFLPGVLSALSIQGLLDPFENMINKVLFVIPNIIAAILIILIGLYIAKKIKLVLASILNSFGIDNYSTTEDDKLKLSNMIASIVYIIFLIPIFSSAFDFLGLKMVAIPAQNMINQIAMFIPSLFSAFILIYLAYFFGNIVGDLASSIVKKINMETVFKSIGINRNNNVNLDISKNIKIFVQFAFLFIGILEACKILELNEIALILNDFIFLVGHIVIGLIIIGLGLFIANTVSDMITDTKDSSSIIFRFIIKASIMFLSIAMGLRQMGIANEIINMGFGFIVGAVSIAFAIAFGFGGKDFAKRMLEKIK
ncbi:MAG: mechanosensitive ion channel [Peptostreptococcaceae bacterium]|jgi:hypothetical protein|nr:mechanosensitive ion channel [Peptostreptococcaceae bacterium]